MSRNTKLELIIGVKDGKIGRNRKLFVDIFNKMDGEYKITIQKNFRKRTTPMNAFLWGIIYPIVMKGLWDVGIVTDIDGVHSYLKSRFLKEEAVNEKTGEVIEIIKSTASLSTTEMQEYWIQIREFSNDFLGVFIPEPDQNYFETKLKTE